MLKISKEKYRWALALTNVSLLVLFISYINYRYFDLKLDEKEFDFMTVASLTHEILIFVIGILSLFGTIFKPNSKFFFYCSILFISTYFVILIISPSENYYYFMKLGLALVYFLIILYSNVYGMYNRFFRAMCLVSGIGIYAAILKMQGWI